ncbi:creatininase family protein [Caldisericum exile]|uniref:Creatininase family protein n=1 Tax=Caldisericum exile (strain DSM 21853 / NBRC 104410 / AZM16c01) TaxID=511051 RepID=A0A7U6GFA9_CALEA|nr:creatininase family protein [Caldisericum exile]BAL81362.1 creatininase family protein [Caldisericum exile AZM16c01]
MELMKMTMHEVKEYLKTNQTIIIPIGATEEHSNALPLGTDTLTAEALARKLGEVSLRIVGPTINVGNCHSITYSFHGTISISPTTLINYLKDYITSLHKHGFRNFFFVNGHGGNIAPLRCAFDELANTLTNSKFLVTSWWLMEELKELYNNAGHAGRGEVSMIMYIDKSLVKTAFLTEEKREIPKYYVTNDLAQKYITETGIINDSQEGSYELGEKLFNASVEAMLKLLKHLEES